MVVSDFERKKCPEGALEGEGNPSRTQV